MIYPNEVELMEFFGVEPEKDDDVTWFRVSDSLGVTLEFSYNFLDDSMQTALHVGGHCACVVCHECMTRFFIDEGTLRANFSIGESTTALAIRINPTIQVDWSVLRRTSR